MAKGNGITAEKMIEAVQLARGYVSDAAHVLGISRKTFYVYMKKYTTVSEALDDERYKRTDYVENQLMKRIDKGDTTAIIFYLKTQAKDRGYVERQELTGKDGEPINTKVSDEGLNRSILTLSDAIRETVSIQNTKSPDAMAASKQAAMAGASKSSR